MTRLASVLYRRLLPALLAICLGGLGPAALAAVPRGLSPGAEEENRSAAEHAVGSIVLSGARTARSIDGRKHRCRPEGAECRPSGRRATPSPTVARVSLRTLEVRIQV